MRPYKCHKVVEAAKVVGVKYEAGYEARGWLLLLDDGEELPVTVQWLHEHEPKRHVSRVEPVEGGTELESGLIGGYVVRYAGGYLSWSPADAFEGGYTPTAELEHIGIERVGRERARQIAMEGYSTQHDDEHTGGELIEAAVSFAVTALAESRGIDPEVARYALGILRGELGVLGQLCELKPASPIRNLEKAGALIVAELDRMLRRSDAAEIVW